MEPRGIPTETGDQVERFETNTSDWVRSERNEHNHCIGQLPTEQMNLQAL